MEILYVLIPVSLIIIGLAVAIFFWAVKSGQYEDLEGPAWRILYDDEPAPPPADDPEPPPQSRGAPAATGQGASGRRDPSLRSGSASHRAKGDTT